MDDLADVPDELAAIHARCFARPWGAAMFIDMLEEEATILIRRPGAFLLGRSVAGEAELLMLAVSPERQRQGIGRELCEAFAATARADGAAMAFLEVQEDNAPALALYAGLDWYPVGRRRDYYGPGLDALILRLDLAEAEDWR